MQQPVRGQRLKGEGAPCTPVPRKQLSTLEGPVDMPKGGIGTGLSVLAYQLCDFGPVT